MLCFQELKQIKELEELKSYALFLGVNDTVQNFVQMETKFCCRYIKKTNQPEQTVQSVQADLLFYIRKKMLRQAVSLRCRR